MKQILLISIILGITVIVILYVIFSRRRKVLSQAMKLILSGQEDEVVIRQTFAQVKNIVNAHFYNVIVSGQTLVFDYNDYTFVVVSRNTNKNETLLAFSQEVKGSRITQKAISHNKKQSSNDLRLLITDSAYLHNNKIIVKTKKIKGIPNTWEHKNDFLDRIKAEKFVQLVNEKGLIDTKYWIEHNEEN